jgi:hypothetical protein
MLLNRRDFATAALALPLATAALRSASAQSGPSDAPLIADSAQALDAFAVDAYIYGYSLITMDYTRRVLTNVTEPAGNKAPPNQFANLRQYPDAKFRAVTAPNADTLYSSAWLDLSAEPQVLSLPDEAGRYYLMPMLSAWTDIFAVPGKRTTGTGAQIYLIAGPSWKGAVPDGLELLRAPTNMVWILGRTYCTGTAEDYAAVHAVQDQYRLVPLSAYGKAYTPPKGKVDSGIDDKVSVRDQVNSLDAESYFSLLALLLAANPPGPQDGVILAKFAALGVVPGKPFDFAAQDPAVRAALEAAPRAAIPAIMAHLKHAGVLVNGWTFTTDTGFYGKDYVQRSLVTAVGLGANLPQDAIYPLTTVDNAGKKLSGANRYQIRFEKGALPPVNGFWSLTMYDAAYFFVENPINRYSVSPRTDLKAGSDGSTILYLQNESPGTALESNWLPAPTGDFILMLRFYAPGDAILNGTWSPPPVIRAA